MQWSLTEMPKTQYHTEVIVWVIRRALEVFLAEGFARTKDSPHVRRKAELGQRSVGIA